jgi:glycine cleavage system H lipoate-binding protein
MWALANLASQLGQEVPLLRVESAKAISDCFAQVSWYVTAVQEAHMHLMRPNCVHSQPLPLTHCAGIRIKSKRVQ